MKVKLFNVNYNDDSSVYVIGSKTKTVKIVYGSIKVVDDKVTELHVSLRYSQTKNGSITLDEKKDVLLQWMADHDFEMDKNFSIFVRCAKFDKGLKRHIKVLIPFKEYVSEK